MTKAKTMWHSFTQRLTARISKPTVALTLCALTLALLAQPVWRALAAAGDLDTTFGGDGISPVPFDGAGQGRLAIQHDGKVLAIAANTVNPVTDDFRLVRFDLNGTPDTSFSGDGIVTTDFGGNGEKSADMAIQFNGKIVIVGSSYAISQGAPQLAIARYLPSGTLDSSFSDDGKALGKLFAQPLSVAFQSDNKIVIGGRYYTNNTNFQAGESVPFLARYNTNGTLDTSFGSQGYVLLSAGTGSSFTKIKVQANDGILAANGQGIRRFLTSGNADPFFGGSGILPLANITDFELLNDGKIVTLDSGSTLRRWSASGYSDAAFAATTLSCPTCGPFNSFALQANGKLVAVDSVGNLQIPTPSNLARVNTNGGLDTNFGASGYKAGAVGFGTDIALMADQRIVTVGKHSLPPIITIARYKNDNNGTQFTDVSVGAITVSPAAVNPGDTVVYTIPVKNNSAVKATHVTLTTNVPVGTTYMGTSVASGWAALQQPSVGGMGTVSASAYELAPGATANVIVLVKVPPTTPHGKTISLSASVSNTTTEITNNNNGYKVFTVQ